MLRFCRDGSWLVRIKITKRDAVKPHPFCRFSFLPLFCHQNLPVRNFPCHHQVQICFDFWLSEKNVTKWNKMLHKTIFSGFSVSDFRNWQNCRKDQTSLLLSLRIVSIWGGRDPARFFPQIPIVWCDFALLPTRRMCIRVRRLRKLFRDLCTITETNFVSYAVVSVMQRRLLLLSKIGFLFSI